MFGNEFGKACNDAKWVDIKGIDAFMKWVNTHIGAIDARMRGELEVRGNALTLLNVRIETTSIYTLTHLAFDCHKF